eukprot:TRINITY_DN6521_c0_g1_i1.p1 TRINITY_DN6521_c0_g1~~TRINITY_DN6521_c0_g1_i1.p1  ORF type:complete len:118 (+),score=1.87 TRINITY_DN6521_c0_g1_i1:101-454(+)
MSARSHACHEGLLRQAIEVPKLRVSVQCNCSFSNENPLSCHARNVAWIQFNRVYAPTLAHAHAAPTLAHAHATPSDTVFKHTQHAHFLCVFTRISFSPEEGWRQNLIHNSASQEGRH